jgi:hypothetical protein
MMGRRALFFLLCFQLFALDDAARAGIVRLHEGFSNPSALALMPGAGGRVAVLESGKKQVTVVDAKGRRSALKGLTDPRGLTSDELGEVLVLDRLSSGGWGLVHFSAGRSSVRKALNSGGEREGDTQLRPTDPVDIAASNRILWILERNPAQVLLYGYDGEALAVEPLAEYGVRVPAKIAIDHDGEVFVTDALGPSVVRMTLSGSVVAIVELSRKGFARPTGVAAGGGELWVGDSITGILAKVDYTDDVVSVAPVRERFNGLSALLYSEEGIWFTEKIRGRVGLFEREEATR